MNTSLNTSLSSLSSSPSMRTLIHVPREVVTSKGRIFRLNDKVRVSVGPQELEIMQIGHGGYIPEMAQYCFKIGFISRITLARDIRVKFGPNFDSPRFTYNRKALELIYFVNDIIEVVHDPRIIRQSNCIDSIKAQTIACKSGRIVEVGFKKVQVQIAHELYWLSHDSIILIESNNIKLHAYLARNCTEKGDNSVENAPELYNHNKKMEEIVELYTCVICLEEIRKMIFLCGHGACMNCCKELTNCPMCRKVITKKIQLF